jgi:hypothetical protein
MTIEVGRARKLKKASPVLENYEGRGWKVKGKVGWGRRLKTSRLQVVLNHDRNEVGRARKLKRLVRFWKIMRVEVGR